MKKIIPFLTPRFFLHIITSICVISVVSFFSFTIGYWVCEHYLFDRVFYRKSVDHGYWVGNSMKKENFGSRVADVLYVENLWLKKNNKESQVLEESSSAEDYKVAVIGDSYVWGQGLRFEQTVTQILEKKLNTVRKTTVLSLAEPADSIFEYMIKFEKISQLMPVDAYFFILVHNDLLLKPHDDDKAVYQNHEVFKICRDRYPDQPIIYDLVIKEYQVDMKLWEENNEKAWESIFNQCILTEALKRLPTLKSAYILGSTEEDVVMAWYRDRVKQEGKKVIPLEASKQFNQFKTYWDTFSDHFSISDIEGHPSKQTHEIYAELMYQELMKHSTYGFVKSE